MAQISFVADARAALGALGRSKQDDDDQEPQTYAAVMAAERKTALELQKRAEADRRRNAAIIRRLYGPRPAPWWKRIFKQTKGF